MPKSHHVVPNRAGGWDVKAGGATRASTHAETKQAAVAAARIISKNQGSELYIHNKNGQIGQKDSHGRDPRDVKG